MENGSRFGRLCVIERRPVGGKRNYFLCKCDCGTERIFRGSALTSGNSKSCGCLAKELAAERLLKHGHVVGGPLHATTEYRIWQNMKNRCHNPKAVAWDDYGGRGISVCEEWRDSFEAFFTYVGKRPADLTLDRINNDGNYEPGNVRWATRKQQANNRRPPKRRHASLELDA